jgi:hypothetical protein
LGISPLCKAFGRDWLISLDGAFSSMPEDYIHPCDKMEARFRRTYPWRKCDEATRKAFYSWQGKRLNLIGKERVFSDFELGLRNVMNGEKSEQELEKLMASWEAFQEAQAIQSEAQVTAQATLKRGATIVSEETPTPLSTDDHLKRLTGMWAQPNQRQRVKDRVAANPGWGIVIGADGPELAAPKGEAS